MNEQPIKTKTITIIGAGTMGTALAQLLAASGHSVKLWAYEPELVTAVNEQHENTLFMPGIQLSSNIRAFNRFEDALSNTQYVLSVTPSQVIRQLWTDAKKYLPAHVPVVCASKGIETHTGKLISEVLEEVLEENAADRLAYLSGPSFAKEIMDEQPTAVVIASKNPELATELQEVISTQLFRAYTTDDVIGVEIGGAIKNVIAIAVGIAEGLGLGINSKSALITRGLAEITRLAVACGAQGETLAGLAGMGDLVLTCNGHLSRNLQVGIRLGKGETLDEILGSMKMVAEGVATAHSTLELAKHFSVDMPITGIVVDILNGHIPPAEAVMILMGRRLRAEKDE
ncbi:MAG: NAD(P)-dependent glycerol-3-phosphate dehydrogenase [Deltaproteobacteria bacterium]|nr:NAD(P)-dependent glycerol-3-phosphate dehydrogenase [Deltaproteobacteria bacterium]MBN2673107.1 NAD(P)-dependent glycerol-3-phosphate dehydrogenase [Deltaproteobacteria bacterium]